MSDIAKELAERLNDFLFEKDNVIFDLEPIIRETLNPLTAELAESKAELARRELKLLRDIEQLVLQRHEQAVELARLRALCGEAPEVVKLVRIVDTLSRKFQVDLRLEADKYREQLIQLLARFDAAAREGDRP